MPDPRPLSSTAIRVGDILLDVRTGEIWKDGVRARLQDHPFAILSLLVEHPGQLVGRDQLRHRLWPNGIVVDFEHGVNSAIKRLREALGDDADNPRYIETVPRRGYRLVAAVRGFSPEDEGKGTGEERRPGDEERKGHAGSRAQVTLSAQQGIETPAVEDRMEPSPAKPRRGYTFFAASVAGVLVLVFLHLALRPRVAEPVSVTYSIVLPAEHPLVAVEGVPAGGGEKALDMSADGRYLAYVAQSRSDTEICVRDNRTGKVAPVPGTSGGVTPLFSPDGGSLAFFAADRLRKVSLTGGRVTDLAEVRRGEAGGWAADRFIYFSLPRQEGLFKVSENGGAVIAVPGGAKGRGPSPSRAPREVPVTLGDSAMGWIRDGQLHEIGFGFAPHFLPGGYLIYALPHRLVGVRFDRASLQITGRPFVVADDVRTSDGVAQFDISDEDTLVYVPASAAPGPSSHLTVVAHLSARFRGAPVPE